MDAIVVGESYGRYFIKKGNNEDLFAIIEENFGEDHVGLPCEKKTQI
ncbi:hypothetical protein [Jeotgalibaca sp. PTS2502]|nr:hypothetical protein [Jeotgalibaca sp. PTS2502]